MKQQIASAFGNSASYYNKYAKVQQDAARRLIASLKPWKDMIPLGPIIELGCGTGFVTEGLVGLYPDREIQVTDLSKPMVDYCHQKFASIENLSFSVQDAQNPSVSEPHYALTVSGFAAQWFPDTALTLGKWLEATKPGGLLLASFPGNESFPEWKKQCEELGLPFTANTLPDLEEVVVKMSLVPAQVDYYEDTVTQTFKSARDFFQQLKKLGASTQLDGRSLSAKEISLLVDHWDSSTEGEIQVSYHLIFLAIKREYE